MDGYSRFLDLLGVLHGRGRAFHRPAEVSCVESLPYTS